MVVYDAGDSDLLMQVLEANLNSSRSIFQRFAQGSAHLIEVINSGVLSGAAYEAGKELFVTYINPMLQKLAQAISDIEADLASYRSADGIVRGYDSHLDEDLLKQQIKNTKELIRLVQQKIEDDENFIQEFMSGGFDKVGAALAELPGLYDDLNNLKQVEKKYEDQLQALYTFMSSTSSLFTDSAEAFKYALQGVNVINQTGASANGTITFPAGADMSWVKSLEGEKFSSKLSTKMDSEELKTLYPQYKDNPKAIAAMSEFLTAISEGKSKKELNAIYDKLVAFTKNKADLKELNGSVKDLQDTYPKAKVTLITKRPEVMPDDDIVTTSITYSYGGEDYGASFVTNKATGKVLSASAGNPLQGLEDYVGAGDWMVDDNSRIPDITPGERAQVGGAAGILGAIATYGEVRDSINQETSVIKGKEYLEQKAKEENENKQANKLRQEQNISHNGGAKGIGTGEDMGGGN